MDRTSFLERPSPQVVNDLTAKFVNRQMGYGRERVSEELYVRWSGFALIAPGCKNVQRRQNEFFGTHNLRLWPHFTQMDDNL